ncbi:hypothetical protein QWJ90_03755 [Microbacterium oryzae]|uniref:hypothetical protein n=1 Tax=Microbacterium oryzae TaxID=743009 RepID=UPI0025B0978C|nr:hypothetical protein [Microbacterium oryzae]MDN3310039.1 hypothetical protein [Microbacterium oryzae]
MHENRTTPDDSMDERQAHSGEVPAGRGGADSGAADLVGVEGTAPASPEEGEQNDFAGVEPVTSEARDGLQTEPRQDVHDTTEDARLQGILVQVQADLATQRIPEGEVRRMLERRLSDVGIPVKDQDMDSLVREAMADPDTSVPGSEPGADT